MSEEFDIDYERDESREEIINDNALDMEYEQYCWRLEDLPEKFKEELFYEHNYDLAMKGDNDEWAKCEVENCKYCKINNDDFSDLLKIQMEYEDKE